MDESVISIINQTYKEWELIIGINGHEPNSETYQTAKKYENEKIRVYDLHHLRGKCTTLNHLIQYCQYDHISLIDVDDIWLENKLEVQIPYLHLYDVIGTKTVYFGKWNNIVPKIPVGDITSYGKQIFSVNPIINSSAIIKKKWCVWDSHYEGVEDYELWLRIQHEGGTLFNCNEICVKHRIHDTSAFNTKNHNEKIETMKRKYSII